MLSSRLNFQSQTIFTPFAASTGFKLSSITLNSAWYEMRIEFYCKRRGPLQFFPKAHTNSSHSNQLYYIADFSISSSIEISYIDVSKHASRNSCLNNRILIMLLIKTGKRRRSAFFTLSISYSVSRLKSSMSLPVRPIVYKNYLCFESAILTFGILKV